jgi:predicted nucleic acid-binding protein
VQLHPDSVSGMDEKLVKFISDLASLEAFATESIVDEFCSAPLPHEKISKVIAKAIVDNKFSFIIII